MVSVLDFSKRRLEAFLDEVDHLKEIEFPYSHSRDALAPIYDALKNHREALGSLSESSDPATVKAAAKSALTAIAIYLPLLGFILRSTNVRNAFEIHAPFLRLSRNLLSPTTKIVLSSEWDYSPLTYASVPILPGFALIGLPASESANPFLVPLLGHELGHSVWQQKGVDRRVSGALQNTILELIQDSFWAQFQQLNPGVTKETITTDLFANQKLLHSYEWANAQTEETFCDCIGLRLFGESYMHAFAYLIAPNLGGVRSVKYPHYKRRARTLVEACASYQTQPLQDYEALFEDLPLPSTIDLQSELLLNIADAAFESMIPAIIKIADEIVTTAKVATSNDTIVSQIVSDFAHYAVPARHPNSLASILNAGWKAYHDPTLWVSNPIINRDRTLKELLLKSFEVLEFNTVTQST